MESINVDVWCGVYVDDTYYYYKWVDSSDVYKRNSQWGRWLVLVHDILI